MPLVSYRASAEPVLRWERSDRVVPGLHEIREVAALGAQRPSTHRGGHRQSAKQLLNAYASSISFTASVISATASFASLKSIFVLSA